MGDLVGKLPPHVLILPYPAQGHINSMLKLAEFLCHAGLHVTFLITHHIHRLLLRHSTIELRFARYPGFRFETISDGLPEEHPRFVGIDLDVFYSFRAIIKPLLIELLISDRQRKSDTQESIRCIISDLPLLSFGIDVGEEIGIPVFCYCTSSTCDFWAFFCTPKLIEAGEFPFKEDNLDVGIASVPGMEGFLRCRDLSAFCRLGDLTNQEFRTLLYEYHQVPQARALILNTFEELDGPILAQIRSQCPLIYTIGPLHQYLKTNFTSTTSTNSLWSEDMHCITWLDAQPSRSVIYVSFGSITMTTNYQLTELWHALMNSGKRFLWVIRPDSIVKDKKNLPPSKFLEGAIGKGYIVRWAPQEEVLAHKAVGGFLTHSGWNSTLESIVAGIPMICWPYFGDQQITSRFVGEVWKIGLDMKDSCDRLIIQNMVRDLMDTKKEEYLQSADRMAKLAKIAVTKGGSTYCSLDLLVQDIRLISVD